jgi:hypothetical protein
MQEAATRNDLQSLKNRAPSALDVDNAPQGVLIEELALLPERTLIDERRLAMLLKVTPRTVRRMVARFELPPSIRLAGRSVWMAGHVLAHIQAAAERASNNAEHQARRLRNLGP